MLLFSRLVHIKIELFASVSVSYNTKRTELEQNDPALETNAFKNGTNFGRKPVIYSNFLVRCQLLAVFNKTAISLSPSTG